jgi:hypothetical protein
LARGICSFGADHLKRPPFHFEAVSNVLSFAYVGGFKILGANYSTSVAVPVTYFGSKMKPRVSPE